MKLTRYIGLGVLLGFCGSYVAAAQQDPKMPTLNIAPAPLGKALTAFAQQSGVQIILDARLAEGVNSAGVVGTYSLQDAIQKLLASTPFRAEWLDGHTIAIRLSSDIDKKSPKKTGIN